MKRSFQHLAETFWPWPGTICLGTFVMLGVISDLVGARYLQHFEDWRQRAVAREVAQASSFQRIVVVGDPLEQNAAIWYRKSFATLRLLPSDSLEKISQELVRVDRTPSPVTAQVHDLCREMQRARVRDALRCTHCDWELGLMTNHDIDESQREALILGRCLILQAHVEATLPDWPAAADALFDALSFACDLSQADFGMSLVGMVVARSALDVLGKVIGAAGDDTRFIDETFQKLSRFEGRLPNAEVGLRLLRLTMARDLRTEALSFPKGHVPVLPWRAIAAWRLSRDKRALDLLEEAANTNDLDRRPDLQLAIERQIITSHSRTVSDTVPRNWVAAVRSGEYLARVLRAVQTAIKLQEWYARNRRYPDSSVLVPLRLDLYGLTYEPTDSRQGYKIAIAGSEPNSVLVEQPSWREHTSRLR